MCVREREILDCVGVLIQLFLPKGFIEYSSCRAQISTKALPINFMALGLEEI